MREGTSFAGKKRESCVVFRRASAGKLRRILESIGEVEYEILTYSEDLPEEIKRRFSEEAEPQKALLLSRFKPDEVYRMLEMAETEERITAEMKKERAELLADHEKNCAWREAFVSKNGEKQTGKPVNLAGGFFRFINIRVWWKQLRNTLLDNIDEIIEWLSDSESGQKEIFRSERQSEAIGSGIQYRNGFLEYGPAYRSRLVLIKDGSPEETGRFRIAAFYPEGGG